MRKLSMLALLASALIAATASRASEMAIDHSGGVNYFRGTFANFGWTFTTSQDRSVSGLGVFDLGSDGLADAHEVGIWDANGSLLVSAIVKDQPLTSSTSARGDWRFASVDATFLAAGSYTIGAYYPTSQDGFVGSAEDAKALVSAADWIDYGEGMVTTGGTQFFARPDSAVSDQFNPAFFGTNFLSSGVPEPATWAMMLIGFGAIGYSMRRSRTGQARLAPA
jgi:hypothetical protein